MKMNIERKGHRKSQKTQQTKPVDKTIYNQELYEQLVGNLKQAYDFTTDIIDKQYRSYVWNDGKVQALVAIDAALIVGIFLIQQIFYPISLVDLCLLGASFLFLIISFLVCLVHVIPRMNSKIGNESNFRTMIGISRFNKDEYYAKIIKTNLNDMVRMNCWQISGMCKNNLRSHNLVRYGVYLTICGVIILAIALPLINVTDWNRSKTVPTQQYTPQVPITPSSLTKSTNQPLPTTISSKNLPPP